MMVGRAARPWHGVMGGWEDDSRLSYARVARARRSLYLAPDLRCRECQELGYASQRSGPSGRAQLRMAKVMSTLVVETISDLDLIARPKYMRLRRYIALLDALGSVSALSFLSARDAVRKIGEKLVAEA